MTRSKKVLSLFLITVFAVGSMAMIKMDATEWSIDKSHSSVNFTIRHFFSQVPGQFDDYTADINFSPENLNESTIDVTIQVASIDTDNQKRDDHLRTADFFNAEKYPTITFKSSEIEQVGENKFVANGKLTIKDVTTDFELPFTLLGVQENPFDETGNTLVAGISSEFTLKRNDFNVGTGDWVSDKVVGDEVNVTLNLELNSEKSAS